MLLAMVLVSCGSGTTTPIEAAQDTGSETPEAGAASEPRIGCEGGPYFSPSVLEAAPPLIEDSTVPEVADALSPFLDGEEGAFWPQDGWRVLSLESDLVELVHPGSAESPQLAFMAAERLEGQWRWAGASAPDSCGLVLEPVDDVHVVEWELDPSGPQPGPASTELVLLATERACASGQAMGERLLPPQVVVTSDEVRIVLSAEPRGGGQNCPGNPSQAVTVVLSEALGERAVVDGRSTELGDLQDVLRDLIGETGARSSTAGDPVLPPGVVEVGPEETAALWAGPAEEDPPAASCVYRYPDDLAGMPVAFDGTVIDIERGDYSDDAGATPLRLEVQVNYLYKGDLQPVVIMNTWDFSLPGHGPGWDPTGTRILTAVSESLDVTFCGFTRPYTESDGEFWAEALSP
jgi:hypothetical protein